MALQQGDRMRIDRSDVFKLCTWTGDEGLLNGKRHFTDDGSATRFDVTVGLVDGAINGIFHCHDNGVGLTVSIGLKDITKGHARNNGSVRSVPLFCCLFVK